MYELENMLLQMQEHLEKVVTQAKADLNTTVPEGHLRISIDKNKPRYYQCIDDNKGVYIPRDNKELPKRLAQKGNLVIFGQKDCDSYKSRCGKRNQSGKRHNQSNFCGGK